MWFFIKIGWKVCIFNLCKVGVWFNKMGCFCIIFCKIFYIMGFLFWIIFLVVLRLGVRWCLIKLWIIKVWNSFIVILCGNLYWCNERKGLIIIIEWFE